MKPKTLAMIGLAGLGVYLILRQLRKQQSGFMLVAPNKPVTSLLMEPGQFGTDLYNTPSSVIVEGDPRKLI